MLAVLLVFIHCLPQTGIQKEFKVFRGGVLGIDLKSGGAIEISGWEQDIVSIKAYLKGRSAEYDDIKFIKTESGVKVESQDLGRSGRALELKIQAPKKFNLDLKTMGGGITIRHIDGKIEGKTVSGALTLVALKGKIDLKTLSGDIVLRDSDIDGRLKTLSGRVLFENVIGDIKGISPSGNVIYKNVRFRSGESPGNVVHITTMSGSINVSDAPEGAEVHTMGGKIHIRSAKRFVSARTMGGDIVIDNIDGWVKATTMGGDIKVVMTGDPGKGDRHAAISSMGGDVSLTVPRGLSLAIEIELVFTKDSRGKFKIDSDFALKERISDKWDFSCTLPSKTISAAAAIRGGKHKIKIKTINGNIYLKESK